MLRRLQLRPLAALLIAYLLLASLYSIITPVFEASDEVWHYPMVKYVADNWALPVQRPEEARQSAWRQEGSQPPLYYMLAAALTFWIDTSDLPAVRRINPHADIGVIVPDGNVNMTIHDPAARSFPWHGTMLAVHIARLFSVLLGAITVLMTYRLTDALFPYSREWSPSTNRLALAAAGFTAFNPMFLFISGSVNNDNLSTAIASWLLVLSVGLLKRTDKPTIRELVWIGVLAGAGMLAKFNIGFLLPVIALALALLAYRLRDWRFFVTGALITGGLTILIGGWWYVRNWQLYGDPTGLNVFIQIVGPRAIPANWAQLWSERHTFLMSYWGFFGGVNVPLPDVVYTVFNAIAALAGLGLGVWVARGVMPSPRDTLNADFLCLSPSAERRPILLGRAVTVLWSIALFAGLIRWTSETWASQGRLMFAAIAPLSMWMAAGLFELMPRRKSARLIPAIAAGWFILVALLAPIDVIARAYTYEKPIAYDVGTLEGSRGKPSIFIDPEDKTASLEIYRYFGLGYSENSMVETIPPRANGIVGQFAEICPSLQMRVGKGFSRDWSAFLHYENADGVIIAQRDVYLKRGLMATSLAREDERWVNCFDIFMPAYAYAPKKLKIYLGFYDVRTGIRMIARGDAVTADNRAYLGEVTLSARPCDLPYPNPMTVNLGDETELIGYDFAPATLLAQQGDQVTVTLYWRAKHPLTTDYRVFAQIVEPNTTNVFARSDAMPANWTRPTSTWKPGEVIEDKHTLTIDRNAPPGTWQFIVGMYELNNTPQGQQFRRLRVLTPDGGEADDFVALTRVKIDPAEIFWGSRRPP